MIDVETSVILAQVLAEDRCPPETLRIATPVCSRLRNAKCERECARAVLAFRTGSRFGSHVVKVHYEGKLIDGTVFDSSIKRGEPAEFPLTGVVPCWTEALQKMKSGEKAQVVCPSSAAYGDRGSPPSIPPGATPSFEVELLDFHKP